MEQYQLLKKSDFDNLRFCLDNYTATHLFIRLMGSSGGNVKVNEILENRILDFSKNDSGIKFIIDNQEIFSLSLTDYQSKYQKGLVLEYERFEEYTYEGKPYKRQILFGLGEYTYGIDPYDKRFPEPDFSVLRVIWAKNHLVEISFDGRIDIKFNSWWNKKSGWKYWELVK